MSAATEFFFMLVGEYVNAELALVTPDTPLQDVAGLMATSKYTAVTVVDDARRPLGIVTEQDMVRRVVFHAGPDQPVADIMSQPVHTIGKTERMYIAIARMRRLGHRHMPVVDGEGRVSGILDLHRTIEYAASDLIRRIEDLTRGDSLDGLRDVKAAQVDIAGRLLADSVPALEVQRLITHINNDIYRRLTRRNMIAMAEEEWGAPPVAFNLIIMGSGGRGENFLSPDQDYGFILADYADDEHNDVDGWFIELATRLSDDLNTVGLPYCIGNVMATNPLWRKTISQWKAQVDYWNARAASTVLLHFDIFFDFRATRGDAALAHELRRHVTKVTRGNGPLLRALFTADRDHGTARRWFGRFATERKKPDHKGEINLKLYGSLPLVEGVRMLALREGVEATATSERLAALHEAGQLTGDEFDDLKNAQETLCTFLMGRQIADFEAEGKISSYLHPGSLTRRQRRRLREAFKAIDGLRARIKFEFGGEVF